MSLNYVTLTLDLYDGQGNPVIAGEALFTPSVQLTDTTDHMWIPPAPVPCVFHAGGLPTVKLLATDNSAPAPSGWGWTVSFSGVPGNPAGFTFFLPYADGSSQYLSSQAPVSSAAAMQSYLPLSQVTSGAAYQSAGGGHSSKLQGWFAALANRDYARANVVVIGDSITAGQGTSGSFPAIYCQQLAANLRAKFPVSGVTGGRGWLNPYPQNVAVFPYITIAGSPAPAQATGYSPDLSAWKFTASGQSWTYSLTGDSCDIM